MLKKKVLTSVITTILAISLATGCAPTTSSSSSVATSTPTPTQSSSQATPDVPSEKDYSEKVTIQINMRDADKVEEDKLVAYVLEKFNIELDLISTNLSDVNEKARVWAAGGDIPEVFWFDFKVSMTGEVNEWIDAGLFSPLPEINADTYPNLAKLNDTMTSKSILMPDGQQYFWLPSRGFDSFGHIGSIHFYYRADWAEELGMYQDEYTWEEMLALNKAFIEQDPGGNGAGKTIGMVSATWAYPGFAGLDQYEPYWDGFKLVDGEYVWGPSLDTTMEGIKEVKRLYDEGQIWEDLPLAKSGSESTGRYEAGQSGIIYSNFPVNGIESIMNNLEKNEPGVDVSKAMQLMRVTTPDGEKLVSQNEEFYGALAFREDIDPEKMSRFMDMMEFIASPEGWEMRVYGIEGEDYTKSGDEYTILWEKDENGTLIKPFPNEDRLFSMVHLTSGLAHTIPTYREEARQARIDQIEWTSNSDELVYSEIDYAYSAFSAPNKDKYNLGTEANDKVKELIMSSDDIEKDFSEWVAATQPKADLILEELNTLFLPTQQ